MSYKNKNQEYYGNPRGDIFDIFDSIKNKDSVLEIGCGYGALGARIIEESDQIQLDGVELNMKAKEHLVKCGYRNIYLGDASEILRNEDFDVKYDVVIMADVLEHINEDVDMLRLVYGLLKPSGHLIISVPNINNWQTIRNLYFKKSFPRDISGIFDSTHLRWYTKKDILNITSEIGFVLVSYNANKDRFRNLLDYTAVPFVQLFHKEMFVSQHLLLLQHV